MSKGKAMPEQFFASSGNVHTEFTPEGATVNKFCYKGIHRRLQNVIHCKHPELWHMNNWLLLQDNTLAHRSGLVKKGWQNSFSFCHTLHMHLPVSKKSYMGINFG
jgi:hypothetical protein